MSLYQVQQVASLVYARCKKDGHAPSRSKLHPLLYFVQSQFLQEKNQPCFDSAIYAIEQGPWVDDLDIYLSEYQDQPLDRILLPEEKMESSDAKILNHAIDPACSVSENDLNETVKLQMPYRAALASKSKEILPQNIRKYFQS